MADIATRIPPQSLEVEKHVLGGLWLGDSDAYRALDILGPDDFYHPKHAVLFVATKQLQAKDSAIDLVTVSELLKSEGTLDAAGGTDYLLEISAEVVSAARMDDYCSILKEKTARRKLIRDAMQVHEAAWNESVPLDEVRGLAESRLLDAPDGESLGPVSAKSALISTMDLIERVHKGEMLGLQTQYHAFNEASGGLCAPDWIVLAGRPATGKTALALDISDYLATDCDKSVLFFSLEMDREQLMQRVICRREGIDFKALRTGKLPRSEFAKIASAVKDLIKSKLYIDDASSASPGRLLSIARRHKAKYGLDFMVVDNLSLMDGDRGGDDRLQEVSRITKKFKQMAKKLKVPIMTLVHLNRGIEERGEDPIPRMRDLRECGTIEQDADNVYVMVRPDPRGTRVDIHGLKQRNGEANIVIPLTSEFEFQRFKSYEGPAGRVG